VRESKIRVRDLPLAALNPSTRPYFLPPGVLAEAAGFTPYAGGGYRRTPQWAAHKVLTEGYVLYAASPVGPIAAGGTAQITAAVTTGAPGHVPSQIRVLADGTAAFWGGMQGYGSNQDVTRRDFRYLRYDGAEYVVGFDVDTTPLGGSWGCGLFQSRQNTSENAWPVGAEPMDSADVTLTPVNGGMTADGRMGRGWVRFYFAYRTAKAGAAIVVGAPDLTNYKEVELTGGYNRNSVTIENLPAGNSPNTDQIHIYRTRVVATRSQLALEPAYYVRAVTDDIGSITIKEPSDADLVKGAVMERTFNCPGMKQHGVFRGNLGLGVHLGHLWLHGVSYDHRIYFSGYTSHTGEVVPGEDYWNYFVATPRFDRIVAASSVKGKMFVLGRNGLYRLADDAVDPSAWVLEPVASLNGGVSPRAVMFSGSDIFLIARSVTGEWGVWATDGYNLARVGDEMSLIVNEDSALFDFGGMAMLGGTAEEVGHIRAPHGAWGRQNLPTGLPVEVCGRDDTFQSGAMLMAYPTGIYYAGAEYSEDESDYLITREYVSAIMEERTEYEKVYVYANVPGDPCTIHVSGSINGGAWVAMSAAAGVVVDTAAGGVYEVPVPPELRHGRRFSLKITVETNADLIVEGVVVQVRPAPAMT